MKKIKEFSEKENAVLFLTGLEEKKTYTGELSGFVTLRRFRYYSGKNVGLQ